MCLDLVLTSEVVAGHGRYGRIRHHILYFTYIMNTAAYTLARHRSRPDGTWRKLIVREICREIDCVSIHYPR